MAIEIHKGCLGYGGRKVVSDLDFSLQPGQVTALIGPNGCGKSTILRAMSGLIKPLAGEVLLNGTPIYRQPRRQLAKTIAFLPQSPQTPENMTVHQLVEQGRYAHRRVFSSLSREDTESIDWAMQQAGVTELRSRYLMDLSGGERQRVWIAAALAQKAQILLLDEPTTYLDLGHQLEVLELLQSLSREQHLTVALSIHELNHALMFADNIAVLNAEQLKFNGDALALSHTQLLEDTFAVHGRYLQQNDNATVYLATASAKRKSKSEHSSFMPQHGL